MYCCHWYEQENSDVVVTLTIIELLGLIYQSTERSREQNDAFWHAWRNIYRMNKHWSSREPFVTNDSTPRVVILPWIYVSSLLLFTWSMWLDVMNDSRCRTPRTRLEAIWHSWSSDQTAMNRPTARKTATGQHFPRPHSTSSVPSCAPE